MQTPAFSNGPGKHAEASRILQILAQQLCTMSFGGERTTRIALVDSYRKPVGYATVAWGRTPPNTAVGMGELCLSSKTCASGDEVGRVFSVVCQQAAANLIPGQKAIRDLDDELMGFLEWKPSPVDA